MNRLGRIVLVSLVALVLCPVAIAFAQGPAVDPKDLNGVIDALRNHNYVLAFGLAVLLMVAFLRWAAPKIHGPFGAWLNTSRASAGLALLSGIVAAIVAGLVAGVHISLDLVISGIKYGVLAIGGWNAAWDIVAPADKKPDDGPPKLIMPTPGKAAALLPFLLLPMLMVSGCKTGGGKSLLACELASLSQTLKDAQPCIEAALARPDFMTAVTACKGVAIDQARCIIQAVTAAAEAKTKTDGGTAGVNPVDINVATHGRLWLNAHKK